MVTPAQPNGGGPLFPELSLDVPDSALPGARTHEPHTAAEWVAHIREQDMPALGATVALIQKVTGDEKATNDRLAQVILQDPAMTAKVLKLANSAFYNPTRQGISTISRAIIVLGFNIVAEIAVGVRLVEALLAGGVQQRVLDEMALSFHAAVQARAIAGLRRDGHGEEVFIASLLGRVGEMAFWCFGGRRATRLDALLASGTKSADEAQMEVLGFKLRQLSAGLAREWKLGPLVQAVLEGSKRPMPPEQTVLLAQRLAEAAPQGWDSRSMNRLMGETSAFVGLPPERLREVLSTTSEEAARVARYYGAGEAADRIPVERPVAAEPPVPEEVPLASNEPNPQLQLKILREISSCIAGGANLNEVLQLVLEGIFRGVGFDRVLFALLSANRQQLVGKTALGIGGDALRQRFIFTLGDASGDLFVEQFRAPRALRIKAGKVQGGLRSDRLMAVTNAPHACIAPILAQGRPIGLFYAERTQDAHEIDDETFEAFQLFVQQVSLAVTAVASRGH